jgi:hypothetical protein
MSNVAVVYVSIGVGATILVVGLAVAVFLLVKFRLVYDDVMMTYWLCSTV